MRGLFSPDDWNAQGRLAYAEGRLDEAGACFARAAAADPSRADFANDLGLALQAAGRGGEAALCYARALELDPKHAEALLNLGNLALERGDLDEAGTLYERARAASPASALAWYNLGNVHKERGELNRARLAYDEALRRDPDLLPAHSNRIVATTYDPRAGAAALAAALAAFRDRFGGEVETPPPVTDRDPERRLRIGYVSPDLRRHPVGRLVLPLWTHHDRARHEVLAYATGPRDDLTDRLAAHTDRWVDARGLSDEALADRIRADGVDVLVDLSMHTAQHRLRVFARRPAPVQVTHLAYPGTTGVPAITHRLTDVHLDPPGADPAPYTEEPVHLSPGFLCYHPVAPDPRPRPPRSSLQPPASSLVFGCLNAFWKASDPALDAWARILAAVPDARLVLHAPRGRARDRVAGHLTAHRVEPSRVAFVERVPMDRYFQIYEEIDLALDPFPANGGTTTCDALWMGVPVVTLAGDRPAARLGASVLAHAGRPDLVCPTVDAYVARAVELASDRAALARDHLELPAAFRRSLVMQAPAHARALEEAVRDLWRRFCAAPQPG